MIKVFQRVLVSMCIISLMGGCATKGKAKTGVTGAPEVKEEVGVESKGTVPGEEGTAAAQPDVTEKGLEEKGETKTYPGIEGEFIESSMLKDVYFAFDKSDLSPEARNILEENAAALKKFGTAKIQIEGHCDERGSTDYNLALGERRAASVKSYLTSLGIPEDRLSTISYGEEMPADPEHTEEAWAKNRRAHTIILQK